MEKPVKEYTGTVRNGTGKENMQEERRGKIRKGIGKDEIICRERLDRRDGNGKRREGVGRYGKE